MANKEMEKGGSRVAALVVDLMFASRVRGAAPDAAVVQTPDALVGAIGADMRLVLVDLQAGGALEALRRLADRPDGVRVVAWGPHVMEEALAAAREAGADDVLPRGAFVKALPGLVAELDG